MASDGRIVWRDLDLSTASGAATFDQRVEAVARRLCRFARRQSSRIPAVTECKASVHAEAVDLLPDSARDAYFARIGGASVRYESFAPGRRS